LEGREEEEDEDEVVDMMIDWLERSNLWIFQFPKSKESGQSQEHSRFPHTTTTPQTDRQQGIFLEE
jgi:hypothetical protein